MPPKLRIPYWLEGVNPEPAVEELYPSRPVNPTNPMGPRFQILYPWLGNKFRVPPADDRQRQNEHAMRNAAIWAEKARQLRATLPDPWELHPEIQVPVRHPSTWDVLLRILKGTL